MLILYTMHCYSEARAHMRRCQGRNKAEYEQDGGQMVVGHWRDRHDTGGTPATLAGHGRRLVGHWRDTGETPAGHGGTLAGHRRDTGGIAAGHGRDTGGTREGGGDTGGTGGKQLGATCRRPAGRTHYYAIGCLRKPAWPCSRATEGFMTLASVLESRVFYY